MAASVTPANFLVDPVELRKAGTVLLTAVALIEASHAARAGRPLAFIFGQATLAPIVADLIQLASVCGHSAANYEACEASLTPGFLKNFGAIEPTLAKAVAAFGLEIDTAIGGGETAVAISRVGTSGSISPQGTSDLLAKLEQASHSQQILVESGTGIAGRQFILYLPGTENWKPIPNSKVFDLTSDLAAMSKAGVSAPERAAVQALRASGFGSLPTDRLVIAGYSEGGLIGANLIASGAVANLGGRVAGLIAVASPISSAKIPESVKVLAIEHVNDPVPKLDLAEHQESTNWQTVKLKPSGLLGHSLTSYRESVRGLGLNQNLALDKHLSRILESNPLSRNAELTGYVAKRL